MTDKRDASRERTHPTDARHRQMRNGLQEHADRNGQRDRNTRGDHPSTCLPRLLAGRKIACMPRVFSWLAIGEPKPGGGITAGVMLRGGIWLEIQDHVLHDGVLVIWLDVEKAYARHNRAVLL